jgi:hypothetical protein
MMYIALQKHKKKKRKKRKKKKKKKNVLTKKKKTNQLFVRRGNRKGLQIEETMSIIRGISGLTKRPKSR